MPTTTATTVAMDSATDDVTMSASNYREQIFNELRTGGHKVVSLIGMEARRTYVAEQLGFGGVRFFTGVGHGNARAFTGRALETIFSLNSNPEQSLPLGLIHGGIIHLLSCHTGLELGPAMIREGCLAFFGYTDYFRVDQPNAEAFWRVDTMIPRLLIQNFRAGEVLRQVRDAFDQARGEMLEAGQDLAAEYLLFDALALVGLSEYSARFGDINAQISPG